MYKTFSWLYFKACWLAYLAIMGVAGAQLLGYMPRIIDFQLFWMPLGVFWVGTSGIGQLVMIPHMRSVRDNYPALWREFHYVPGMTEWAEKTFAKDSPMNKKYNSFAMFKYAFSLRDHKNPELRHIKACLRSEVLYTVICFVSLIVIGFLYSI